MRTRYGALLGAWLLFGLGAGVARADFLPASSYPIGAAASAVGQGDFTGDGIPDLVVARPANNDIVIYPGRPDGTFGSPLPPIAVGTDPVAVTGCIPALHYHQADHPGLIEPPIPVPDFKLDGPNGTCDLAVSDAGSHDIAFLLSNGNGTFAKPIFVPVAGTPGAITAIGSPAPEGVVFAEPQQNQVGFIAASPTSAGTFMSPTYTDVGADPEAVASAPEFFEYAAGSYFEDWYVYVADTGSNDVRGLEVFNTTSGPELDETESWQVDSSPISLAVGAFNPSPLAVGSLGVAVADRDSGDIVLLGSQAHANQLTLTPIQSAPIPVGAGPIALATVTRPGGRADGDLAVLNQGAGTVTLLQQTTTTSDGWPTFTQTSLSAPGAPTTLIAWPFRFPPDPEIWAWAPKPPTDLALLDPAGAFTVLLQDAPRLALDPKNLQFEDTTAGGTSTTEFSITNYGSSPTLVDHLRIPGWSFPESIPFSIIHDGCSGTILAPGGSCTGTIQFAPKMPGDWEWALYAYTGPSESSVFGGATMYASAGLQGSVSTPAAQDLRAALSQGVRASAKCSATCSIVVRAVASRHQSGLRAGRLVGIARYHLSHGRRARIRIPIRDFARRIARMSRADLVLRATASAAGYHNGTVKTFRITLKRHSVHLVTPR